MERELSIIAYLLARMVGRNEGVATEQILSDAIKAITPEKKPKPKQVIAPVEPGAVDRIYSLYPTKCPVSGRATGKSYKDKVKLESLLKGGHTEEELSDIIERYVKDCIRDKSYIKNFQTFLNNLPDYKTGDLWQNEPDTAQSEPVVYYQSLEELEAARKAKKNQ